MIYLFRRECGQVKPSGDLSSYLLGQSTVNYSDQTDNEKEEENESGPGPIRGFLLDDIISLIGRRRWWWRVKRSRMMIRRIRIIWWIMRIGDSGTKLIRGGMSAYEMGMILIAIRTMRAAIRLRGTRRAHWRRF